MKNIVCSHLYVGAKNVDPMEEESGMIDTRDWEGCMSGLGDEERGWLMDTNIQLDRWNKF